MSILKSIAKWLKSKSPNYELVWITPKKPVGYIIPSMGGYPSSKGVTVMEPDYTDTRLVLRKKSEPLKENEELADWMTE